MIQTRSEIIKWNEISKILVGK